MNDTTTPFVPPMQSKDDPEHKALRDRFWRGARRTRWHVIRNQVMAERRAA